MTATAVASFLTPDDRWRLGGRGGKQRMIPDPETGELRPYLRVSTFAKALDDKEGLISWKAWMAVRGTVKDRALTEQALAAQSTPRTVIDQLAELGGGGVKRDRGSDRHELLAMALRGADMSWLPEQGRTELRAVLDVVEGLGVVQQVEAPLVCDEFAVAGRCDLILKAPDGRVVVADFKTGSDRRLSSAIQLVCYARSHHWNWDSERRMDLVSFDLPRLVVIHAPQDGSPPKALDIPPAEALRWAQLAAQVIEARKRAQAAERYTS